MVGRYDDVEVRIHPRLLFDVVTMLTLSRFLDSLGQKTR